MSGFFGLFNRDEIALPRGSADKMLESISCWKPDTNGKWESECAAVGHSMLWNTPQSKLEQLPYQHEHLIITMDARLDDRQGLAERLNLSNCNLNTTTDSELILKAYCKWAEECPKYLLGDFAFAIWDTEKQQFFCARDHIGVKQFYFHLTSSFFALSNDLKALSEYPDIPKTPDDVAVANFLVNSELIHNEKTFFKEIQKLQPAHSLIVTNSLTECKCYWTAHTTSKNISISPEACATKLRTLLNTAVYDRIHSAYPIISHLSGGIDSSAIAVIAARKLKESNRTLLAFNWLQEPSPTSDLTYYEWANSKTITDLEGITHKYVSLSRDDIYQHMSNHTIAYGNSAIFWYEFTIHKVAREKGARSILSGWGGDEVASYHGQSYFSDLLFHWKFFTFLKELKAHCIENKQHFLKRIAAILYHKVLLISLPSLLARYMPRNRNRQKPNLRFIKKDFQAVFLNEWKKASLQNSRAPTIKMDMLHYLDLGHIQSRIESWAAGAMPNRLEYSYPLLDKRIIEFVLSLPAECFVRKGKKRYLYRMAIKDLLPEEVLWGETKPEPQRVKQLVSCSLHACKKDMKKKGKRKRQSDYVDVNKLAKIGSSFSVLKLNETSLQMVIDVETSWAVVSAFGQE
jgi:asparagine synthase (glutamine-hydrolysing)